MSGQTRWRDRWRAIAGASRFGQWWAWFRRIRSGSVKPEFLTNCSLYQAQLQGTGGVIILFGDFFTIVILMVVTTYLLARRLHRLDPDLTTFEYFKRLLIAQGMMASVFGEGDLMRKPNGEPVHKAFTTYVLIMVGCFLGYLMLALLVFGIYRRG